MWILLYTLLVGWVAVLAQMFLPDPHAFFAEMGLGRFWPLGLQPELLILVIIWAALRLQDLRVFIITVILGFSFDLVTPARLGGSIFVLSAIAALVMTQAKTRFAKQIPYQILLVMVGTFLYQIFSYSLVSFQLWRWHWPFHVWSIIIMGSAINAIFAPIAFSLLDLIPRLFLIRSEQVKGRGGYSGE